MSYNLIMIGRKKIASWPRAFWIGLIILGLGLVFRLVATSHGNFIFNMDNARDWVDVREMIELHKWRLIGQTSGIQGLFTGPGWYYLLTIPYLVSGGDPYSAVVLMMGLWLLGGIFLLWCLQSRGGLAMVMGAILWVCAPFLLLATTYAYNPNPVELLTPVLVFWLWRYLETQRRWYILGCWLLAGVFFNFEMAAGITVPAVIVLAMIWSGRWRYFWSADFWLGVGLFIGCLLPQFLFELKHDWFMTRSVLNHVASGQEAAATGWNRVQELKQTYQGVLSGTLINTSWLVNLWLLLGVGWLIVAVKQRQNSLLISILTVILGPILSHLILPVNVMPWHLGLWVGGIVLLAGYSFGIFQQRNMLLRVIVGIGAGVVAVTAIWSLEIGQLAEHQNSQDPAVLKNEQAAIDAVYADAAGRQFRVYTYMPSVIDYPYQYLIWWHGAKAYGYLPLDYAYAPNKPPYISGKSELGLPRGVASFGERSDSGLVYLIKQPDEPQRRELWENGFKQLELVKTQNIGPMVVESRRLNTP